MGDEKRDAFEPLSGDRIAVLAERAAGRCIGAPATRDEEGAMAHEIQTARARIRELEANQMPEGLREALAELVSASDALSVFDATIDGPLPPEGSDVGAAFERFAAAKDAIEPIARKMRCAVGKDGQ